MSSYLFLLGRTPQLSFLELQTLFPDIRKLVDDVAVLPEVKLDLPKSGYSLQQLVDFLGGTVKIAQSLTELAALDAQSLSQILESLLSQKHVTFGFSLYGASQPLPRTLLAEVKQKLVLKGISSRFVAARGSETLSSVAVAKEHILDLVLAKTPRGWLVGRTLVVQSFREWARRDRERPFSDPRRGMLPPKIARMTVNIARSQSFAEELTDRTLLDPFCGMGTILAEALLTGWNVIGSDISAGGLRQAQGNINWLEANYPQIKSLRREFLVSDAVHVSDKLAPTSIDVIVTEPFLGTTSLGDSQNKDQISLEKVRNAIKGLEKLYLGCLKDWYKILKNKGRVIIALPEYQLWGKRFSVKKVIDTCENFGYTRLTGPIEYGRPQAVVKREFFILQKKEK